MRQGHEVREEWEAAAKEAHPHAREGALLLSFTVYGSAAPGGSKTVGYASGGRAFVRDASKRTRPWMKEVARTAAEVMQGSELLEGPLRLSVTFWMPRPKSHIGARGVRPSAPRMPIVRPDVTKLMRALEDALTGIVWRDDAQVVVQHGRKEYGEPARADVLIETL